MILCHPVMKLVAKHQRCSFRRALYNNRI